MLNMNRLRLKKVGEVSPDIYWVALWEISFTEFGRNLVIFARRGLTKPNSSNPHLSEYLGKVTVREARKSGIDGYNYFSTSLDYCAVAALAGNSPVATQKP
jgi:hypothetical protein